MTRKPGIYRLRNAVVIAVMALILMICFAFAARPVEAETGYLLYGDTVKKSGGVFRLTKADFWQGGGLWLKSPVPVTGGMTATFDYRVTGGGTSPLGYADGLVLTIAEVPGLGGLGEGLGFVGGNAYGVEFDSYQNGYDPADPHVSIIRNDVSNHLALKATSLAVSGSWASARVTYAKKTLTLYINGKKQISYTTDGLPDNVYIGISASTGDGYACHEVRKLVVTGSDAASKEKAISSTETVCHISFDPNGGEVSEKYRDVLKGSKYGTLPAPTRKGYKLKGWYTKKKGGKKATKSTKATKSMTLYAVWQQKSKKTYTVQLDPNGGSGSVIKLTKKKGVTLKLTTTKKLPTKKGYSFSGWSTKKNGKVVYRYGGEYKKDKGATLYTVWTKLTASNSRTDKKLSTKKTAEALSKYRHGLAALTSIAKFPIPGLKTTCVYHQGKTDRCDYMVPQGLCIYGDYLFVSAYCKDQLHNSVLHVLRKSDGKFIGTVTLGHPEGKKTVGVWDHNGGIVCDDNGYLWVANSTSGKISGLKAQTVIDKARKGGGKKAVFAEYTKTLNCTVPKGDGNIGSASFLTYDNGLIWAGYCDDSEGSTGHATLYAYEISYSNDKPASMKYVRSWPLPAHANGATFCDIYGQKFLIVSTQNGRKKDSYLTGYLAHDDGTLCYFRKMGSAVMPPMLEELCIDGEWFYSIFESGASPYRDSVAKKAVMTDICVGDRNRIYDLLGLYSY